MWGSKNKPYTASNTPHFLRRIVGDHAGAKMFAMHDDARSRGEITPKAAAVWWQHMNGAITELAPGWRTTHGDELGRLIEKTVRWFCDHVLERLVWGGPNSSPWAPQRLVFRLLVTITSRFARRELVKASAASDTLVPSSSSSSSSTTSTHRRAATVTQIPPNAVPYKRVPANGTFTVETIPRALLSLHNTKAGVWGEINVHHGQLRLTTLQDPLEDVVLTAESPASCSQSTDERMTDRVCSCIGVVAPQQDHVVEPLADDMEMSITFYAIPATTVSGSEAVGQVASITEVQNAVRRTRGGGFG